MSFLHRVFQIPILFFQLLIIIFYGLFFFQFVIISRESSNNLRDLPDSHLLLLYNPVNKY